MDLIGSLLGSDKPGSLSKLQILVEKPDAPLTFDTLKPIEAKFNPTQLAYIKTAEWNTPASPTRDVGEARFVRGQPQTLTVNLLFDSYEDEKEQDVRKKYTNRVLNLLMVDKDLHRPPMCRLVWGNSDLEIFKGSVLTNLNTTFTMFLPAGTPVRATLACTFKECISATLEDLQRDQHSSDVFKSRVVRRGDSLSSIAGEEYRDITLWRPIADANGIDNPRDLRPGQVLTIPVLSTRSLPRR